MSALAGAVLPMPIGAVAGWHIGKQEIAQACGAHGGAVAASGAAVAPDLMFRCQPELGSAGAPGRDRWLLRRYSVALLNGLPSKP